MVLLTPSRLQREFGMPVMRASTLVREQRALASNRYRVLAWLMIAGNLVLIAVRRSGRHWLQWLASPILLGCLLLGALHLYLTHRDSRAPIPAAARTWRDTVVRLRQ